MSISDQKISTELSLSFVAGHKCKLKSKVFPHYWSQLNSRWSETGGALWWKWVIEHFLVKLFFLEKAGYFNLMTLLIEGGVRGEGDRRKTPVLLKDIDRFLSTENNRTECTNTKRAPKVILAENPENLQPKTELCLCDRATRAPHWNYCSGASCSPSSVGQHPLQPGMPDLELVPIAKGDHQLQHDSVMVCRGAGSRRYPNSNALRVLQHRGIMN